MATVRKKFGPFSYHTWTVRMNPIAAEGRSVWEHCPIPKGTPIQLTVQTLPSMFVTIGQNANRRTDKNGVVQWVNKAIVRTGPFPAGKSVLTVGCELWVIPSWQEQLIKTTDVLPAPLFGSDDGVDVRPLHGHEVDRLQVWIGVSDGNPALIIPRLWLRHPTGIWSETTTPIGGPIPVVKSRVFDVVVRDADRVYVSFDYSGPAPAFPDVTEVAYGIMTAPSEDVAKQQFNIRFSAVVAPYE